MKRLLMLSGMLCFATLGHIDTCFGQFQKGNYLVEGALGNGSFINSKTLLDDGKTTFQESRFNGSLVPRLGVFLTNRIAFGVEANIAFGFGQKSTVINDTLYRYKDRDRALSMGLIPFFKVYFGKSKSGKSIFQAQLYAGFTVPIVDRNIYTYYDRTTGDLIRMIERNARVGSIDLIRGAGIGWNRLLTERLALNLNVGYHRSVGQKKYRDRQVDSYGVGIDYRVFPNPDRGFLDWNIGFTMFFVRN
jgi:hypothetical protein